jgi:hypothetical protein
VAGETEVLGENRPDVILATEIPYDLTRDRIQAAAIGIRLLTA